MGPIPLLFLSSLMITVLSCGGGSGGGGGGGGRPNDVDIGNLPEGETNDGSGGSSSRPARLVYDSELSPAERQALDESTEAMGLMAINGGSVKGFSQAFGGNSSSNVVRYFEKRVNYALSGSTNIESRIISEHIIPGINAGELLASNEGLSLWLIPIIQGSDKVTVLINDRPVKVTSSRVGIMKFGPGYVQRATVNQVNTLVHEARHSDCTGGLRADTLESYRAGNFTPENKSCGHTHAICPRGDLAGLAGCDSQPWGAYAIGGIYSLAVAKSCTNCSPQIKSVAMAEALDSLTRLLYDPVDLLEGRLGRPNMNSSSSVQDRRSEPEPQPDPQLEPQPEPEPQP